MKKISFSYRMLLAFCLTGMLLLTDFGVYAQLKKIKVNPHQLDLGIEEVNGSDIALYNKDVDSRNRLILMIQGTGAKATDMVRQDSIFASWGYHVVSIDYKNNVISTVCAHSKDSACSYLFRKEIITGRSLSDKTEVDRANSLINRFTLFLQYLSKHDASGGWDQYLKNNKPNWSKVIAAGHSQGSGHAAMLGKMFKLSRVLLFSGPQDYLEELHEPSPWLSHQSATPEDRYYTFLHLKDPFNAHYQIKNNFELMRHAHPDTVMVSPGVPVQGPAHILVNNIQTKDPHGSTLLPEFENVWRYMLGIRSGFLHAHQGRIMDGEGKEVLLRGVGLGGWMLQEPYMLKLSKVAVNQQDIRRKIAALIGVQKTKEFYKAWLKNGMQKSDVDSLKAWGFNSIRLPMHYDLFALPVKQEPVKGKNTWLKTGFQLTDSLLKWCTEDSIYLILDLHAAPGGQGNDLPIADRDPSQLNLWQSKANQQKVIALWKKLAERYNNERWIGGYDLLNETNISFDSLDNPALHDGGDNKVLWNFLKTITDTIRTVDKNHIIFVEGNGWANDYSGFPAPWDKNMVISFHKYWNKNNVASIQKYLDLRKKYQIPLWLGESGENNNQWYREAVQLMESHDIGWCWWPLKKIGTSCPFEVIMPEGFKKIIQYWKGEGKRPTTKEAYKAFMQLAENYKTENLKVHEEVLHALIPSKN